MAAVAATAPSKADVRDAATVILVRDATGPHPRILMGQRGAKAAFMPNKYVFPGGAVDPGDDKIALARAAAPETTAKLAEHADPARADALLVAAIRELWEETGQVLGTPGHWPDPVPPDWQGFAATRHLPSADGLAFIFRAITPPGRPRRFDARFFVADADRLASDPDDFSHACDELSHLHWVTPGELKRLDLPFITQVVLAETLARLPNLAPPETVPFFRNDDEAQHFLRLGERAFVSEK